MMHGPWIIIRIQRINIGGDIGNEADVYYYYLLHNIRLV